jgi:hypothetical protein
MCGYGMAAPGAKRPFTGMSAPGGILLQKSKIGQAKIFPKVDLWTSLPLRRFSTPQRRSVIDFE